MSKFELIKSKNSNFQTYRYIDNQNKCYILKKYYFKNDFAKICFLRDKSIQFNENFINLFVTSYIDEDNYGIVIREFIEGDNFQNFFKNIKSKDKLKYLINFTTNTLKALKFLHSNNIIHRDVRPSNIMLDKNQNYILIDFASVKNPILAEIDNFKTFSLIYSPPEQILNCNQLVNPSSDLYALGVSMWILLTNKIPFNHQIPEVIANIQLNMPLPKNSSIPPKLMQIIEKATYKEPFAKPPNLYNQQEIHDIIRNYQKYRYQTADEMLNDIICLI